MSSQQYFLGDDNRRNINDYYEMSNNELGKGSYGRVQLAKLKGTSVKRAIKIIEKAKVSNVERFKLEVEIMMKLDHPNILRLMDYFEDPKYVYLVLELCTGGELFDRIISNKYYNEEDARVIFRQIMTALHYCHISGVVHRDLKPENFIMISQKDPFTLKIIDFGLSRTFNSNDKALNDITPDDNQKKRKTRAVLKTKAGTPFYIAPEVLTGNYNEKCDVWSAGVILYILFCGYPPFYGESNKQILEAVKKGKLDFSSVEWKDKSKEAIDLIKKMIIEQDQRFFTDQVLADPWMSMSKVKTIYKEKIKVLFHNMKKYTKLDKFRKLILYFLAKNLQEEDISHYHNYFYLFDTKNKGSIDKESFVQTLKTNLEVEEEVANKVFDRLDLFNQGKISYMMFISQVIPFSKFFSDKRLIIFFQIVNFNKGQTIGTQDIQSFLNLQFKYSKIMSDADVQETLTQFKSLFNNNEEVGFEEFSKVINSVCTQKVF